MNILFVYTEITEYRKPHYYRGLDSVMTVQEESNHKIDLFMTDKQVNREEYIEQMGNNKYDLVAFTSNDYQWQFIKELASWTKDTTDILTLCGGLKPTFDPEDVINDPNIDVLIRGEGEYALNEILNNLEEDRDISGIFNSWVKRKNQISKNELRPLIEDLDSIPMPKRKYFHYQRILDKTGRVGAIAASRGCPFNCTFCSNYAWKKIYSGKGSIIRWNSPQYVVDELRYLIANFKIDHFHFEDEEFTRDKEWIYEFTNRYKQVIQRPFSVAITPANISDEMMETLYEAGCRYFGLGLETGVEEHRKYLNKHITNEQIYDVVKRAKEHGIRSVFSMMVGLPFDSEESIEETMKYLNTVEPHFVHVFVYRPIKHSELYDDCIKNNIITEVDTVSSTQGDTILDLKYINHEEFKNHFIRIHNLGISLLQNEFKYGYSHIIEEYMKDGNISEDIQPNIDFWKYLLILKPILIFYNSNSIMLEIDLKKNSIFHAEIGFYRFELNERGIIEYRIDISDSDNLLLRRKKKINLDDYENIYNYYEDIHYEVQNSRDQKAKVVIGIIRKEADPNIISFWVNPYFKQR